MPIATSLDEFRILLGDRDSATPIYNDVEAQWFIDQRSGSVLLAVADACDALAREYARRVDFAEDGQSVRLSQASVAYREQAKELRQRAQAGGGLSAIEVTRVDGYSDDLSTRDGAGLVGVNGRVRHGYYDEDMPPS